MALHRTHIPTKAGVALLGFFLLATAMLIPQLSNIQDTRSRASFVPTPTNTVCKTGVNSFGVNTSCGTNLYRYSTYSCYDGTTGTQGGPTSCKSPEVWRQYATDLCKGRNSCSMTPTPHVPTPTPNYRYPTPTPTKYPTPTKPQNPTPTPGYNPYMPDTTN